MNDDLSLLRRIAEVPHVSSVLRHLVDFDVEDVASVDGSTARLSSGRSLHLIACDGTAGRYFLVGTNAPSRPVLYATSEGQAGIIGLTLTVALTMLIALPNWHDVLGFSGGGSLDQMRRAHAYFEVALRQSHPDLDVTQSQIVDALGLDLPEDPVLTLWQSVHAAEPPELFIDDEDDDDSPWDPLLGAWTIERVARR
ncbi:hypothetical protein Q0Z83_022120 [Actinoplanes sichuanensis]|uniref:SUKH-4 immunity protein of toxin-antitoxin system n=1 Tax=Actinoplanes sichuanensis TaxID=512349 RepID=A0ABW4AIG7_9ACTN|nr:hypothetical protein [Actinoplanes sichuanensis]BEL04021.1 hypothetical protein Q0Z83_022120 [Actinoplanes sichuanensis]